MTLGADLERRRLRHQVQRLEVVLKALCDREALRSAEGRVPVPLTQAIEGFRAERRRLRRRLDELERKGASRIRA